MAESTDIKAVIDPDGRTQCAPVFVEGVEPIHEALARIGEEAIRDNPDLVFPQSTDLEVPGEQERIRLQGLADQHLADARGPANTEFALLAQLEQQLGNMLHWADHLLSIIDTGGLEVLSEDMAEARSALRAAEAYRKQVA